MECRQKENLKNCPCSYPGCPRKGICCQCLRHHREKGQLPACYFSPEIEKTYDRSIKKFIEVYKK
ncbi:MAG: DUF6485 family protein [Patescibacteria group bacterium]|nr:DUF6485 family protein [Patescibacteria group bacterium]